MSVTRIYLVASFEGLGAEEWLVEATSQRQAIQHITRSYRAVAADPFTVARLYKAGKQVEIAGEEPTPKEQQ